MSDDINQLPAFVIDAPATIDWPVTVTHPVDGGELARFRFTGTFKRLSEEALDELLGTGEPQSGEGEADVKRLAQVLRDNAELFPQVLVGWQGVRTADGDEAPFTAERLRAAVTGAHGQYLSAGLWRAVAEIRNGARRGN